MVDALKTFAELVAQTPDNTSQLISAQDVREYLYALPLDLIEVEQEDDFLVVMTDGVWVDVPTLFPTPITEVARAWIANANSQLVPDFTASVTVDPALVRGLQYAVSVIAEKVGVAAPLTANYDFQNGDGAPAAGDIDFHSNLVQCQVAHVDKDGTDQQAALEATEVGDFLNFSGILQRVTSVVPDVTFVTMGYASAPRPNPVNDQQFQILRTGGSPYEMRMTSAGVQFAQIRDFEIGSTAALMAIQEFASFRPFDQEPLSFQIRPVGHSTDLTVKYAEHRVFGVLV